MAKQRIVVEETVTRTYEVEAETLKEAQQKAVEAHKENRPLGQPDTVSRDVHMGVVENGHFNEFFTDTQSLAGPGMPKNQDAGRKEIIDALRLQSESGHPGPLAYKFNDRYFLIHPKNPGHPGPDFNFSVYDEEFFRLNLKPALVSFSLASFDDPNSPCHDLLPDELVRDPDDDPLPHDAERVVVSAQGVVRSYLRELCSGLSQEGQIFAEKHIETLATVGVLAAEFTDPTAELPPWRVLIRDDGDGTYTRIYECADDWMAAFKSGLTTNQIANRFKAADVGAQEHGYLCKPITQQEFCEAMEHDIPWAGYDVGDFHLCVHTIELSQPNERNDYEYAIYDKDFAIVDHGGFESDPGEETSLAQAVKIALDRVKELGGVGWPRLADPAAIEGKAAENPANAAILQHYIGDPTPANVTPPWFAEVEKDAKEHGFKGLHFDTKNSRWCLIKSENFHWATEIRAMAKRHPGIVPPPLDYEATREATEAKAQAQGPDVEAAKKAAMDKLFPKKDAKGKGQGNAKAKGQSLGR